MSSSNWKRARSDDQVRQRIDEILSAAENLFRTNSYDKVTMQKIASKVGCSQSNIYRYFKNREDVFLTLYINDAEEWLADMIQEFRMELSVEEFSIKWTEILLRQERLLELAPLLDLVLESNSSKEVYRNAKKRFRDRLPEAATAVRRALSSLSEEKALEFLYAQQAFIAGIRPMTQFSPMQRDVLSELGMHQAMLDFPSFFQRTLLNYLRGLLR